MLVERCLGAIKESSKSLMDDLKANDEIKMSLLLSMQQTMNKLIDIKL